MGIAHPLHFPALKTCWVVKFNLNQGVSSREALDKGADLVGIIKESNDAQGRLYP